MGELETILRRTIKQRGRVCGTSEATREATWLCSLLCDLNLHDSAPIPIFVNKGGAVDLVSLGGITKRYTYIDARFHYFREQWLQGVITVSHLPTSEMLADGLTTPLPDRNLSPS